MIIRGANVFGEDCRFQKRDICIGDGVFLDDDSLPGDDSNVVIDAEGFYAIPGLVDIHLHGCMSRDFSDGELDGLEEMALYQAQNGVTAICPASMTLPETQLLKIVRTAKAYQPKGGASLIGMNMEGPFFSEEKKGAQNSLYLKNPDMPMLRRLMDEAEGLIRLLDIAPELDGALDMIREMSPVLRCSVAHTTADYDVTAAAFATGASHVTHLYNAMYPFLHRAPGVVGAAMDAPGCTVELITDGIHIHPSVIRATFRMFGADRVVLVSDSMMATGMEDGDYSLGGLYVSVKGNRAVLEDGTVAGSVTNLMNCMRYAVKLAGIPLEDAVRAATANPAKVISQYERYGSIAPGKSADVVLLNSELEIVKVVVRGEVLGTV